MNQQLVPNLRFPGFSDEWEEKELGDIAGVGRYGLNSAAKPFDGVNKYLRITDIDDDSRNFLQNSVTSPSGVLDDSYLLGEGDLIFTRTGASTGKSYLYRKEDGRVYFAGFLIRFRIKKANPEFVYMLTLRRFYTKWVVSVSTRSGQPGINAEEYGHFKVYLPNAEEQEKIAGFMVVVSNKISTLRQKKELLERYKKSIIQKLFSRRLRFIDENGNNFPNWDERKLSDIFEESVEKSVRSNQYEILSSTSRGLFLQSEYFNKEIASQDNIGYKILRRNQVVFSPQNLWMGNINLNTRFDIGIVSPSYKIYNFSDNINVSYIGYLLKTPRMLFEYAQASEQGASIVRRNLDIDSFLSTKVALPTVGEQKKMTEFLTRIDEKIEAEEKKLEQARKFKKALLQQMFV